MVTLTDTITKYVGTGLWSGLSHFGAYTILFIDTTFIFRPRVWE
jgi:hypothetical protein